LAKPDWAAGARVGGCHGCGGGAGEEVVVVCCWRCCWGLVMVEVYVLLLLLQMGEEKLGRLVRLGSLTLVVKVDEVGRSVRKRWAIKVELVGIDCLAYNPGKLFLALSVLFKCMNEFAPARANIDIVNGLLVTFCDE
jgi:hypothetical protein